MSDKLQADRYAPGNGVPGSGAPAASAPAQPIPRLNSRDLIKDGNGVEIDHDGRIYKLRITQLGKLILTA